MICYRAWSNSGRWLVDLSTFPRITSRGDGVSEKPLDEATEFSGIFVLGFVGFVTGCRTGRVIYTIHPTMKPAVLPSASCAYTKSTPVRSYMTLISAYERPIKPTSTPAAR